MTKLTKGVQIAGGGLVPSRVCCYINQQLPNRGIHTLAVRKRGPSKSVSEAAAPAQPPLLAANPPQRLHIASTKA
eukprot:6481568-Amphidinium_carterae.1